MPKISAKEGVMKVRAFSCSLKNLKSRPNEDYCLVSVKYPIFAVADGVSRDRNSDGSYPNPSGARLVAEEFCREVIKYSESLSGAMSEFCIRKAIDRANQQIRLLNVRHGILEKLDYWINDYFGTCGVVAAIDKDTLYYGYVGDCGLMVFNQYGSLKHVSVNDIAPLEVIRDSKKFFSKKDRALFWRKYLRNKPKADYLTYGTLTGESVVSHYYHIGKLKLQKGDSIILYSDGFLRFIKMQDFRQLFRIFKGEELEKRVRDFVNQEIKKNPGKETTELFGDDKTLIAILLS